MSETITNDSSAERLRSFIERIEKLEAEKADIAEVVKEVYAESKATGFDVKVMRLVVKARKMDAQTRREQEEIYDLYKRAVGLA